MSFPAKKITKNAFTNPSVIDQCIQKKLKKKILGNMIRFLRTQSMNEVKLKGKRFILQNFWVSHYSIQKINHIKILPPNC